MFYFVMKYIDIFSQGQDIPLTFVLLLSSASDIWYTQGAGGLPPFTNISAGRHKYCWRGGGNTNKIFCGLITQIKLVNHGSIGEVRTPATRVITNTATEVPHTDVTAILICYLVCTHSKISMHTYFSCAMCIQTHPTISIISAWYFLYLWYLWT